MHEAPPAHGPSMRLDRFLWFTRLAKTRSVAQAIASDGHLRMNGRAIDRSHCPVRAGDILTFAQVSRIRTIRVVALPKRRGPPAEAQACYEDLIVANVSHQSPDD